MASVCLLLFSLGAFPPSSADSKIVFIKLSFQSSVLQFILSSSCEYLFLILLLKEVIYI